MESGSRDEINTKCFSCSDLRILTDWTWALNEKTKVVNGLGEAF